MRMAALAVFAAAAATGAAGPDNDELSEATYLGSDCDDSELIAAYYDLRQSFPLSLAINRGFSDTFSESWEYGKCDPSLDALSFPSHPAQAQLYLPSLITLLSSFSLFLPTFFSPAPEKTFHSIPILLDVTSFHLFFTFAFPSKFGIAD